MNTDFLAKDRDAKLEELLTHLDSTNVAFREFGCFVALTPDRRTVFACPMNSDGSPERDPDEPPHLSWSEVAAPEIDFLEKVNSVFGTSFDPDHFSGR